MTSSSPSSDASTVSSSSTNLSPSLAQYNFNPFAVHPFTNCVSSDTSSNAPTASYNRSNPLYAYPYRQSPGDYPTFHAPTPSPPLATIPIPSHQQSPSSPPKPYAYTPPRPTGIFVPFRQETSSPDISDVLKSKSKPNLPSDTSAMMTTAKTRPKNTANFVPATPSIGLPGSRKH